MKMGTNDTSQYDLFCRVMVDSELPQSAFCDLLTSLAGGVRSGNTISSSCLDITADQNDVFDPQQRGQGAKQWLYFRYALEIDPVTPCEASEYIKAIGDLLVNFWSKQIKAVAACEFEDLLPTNPGRDAW